MGAPQVAHRILENQRRLDFSRNKIRGMYCEGTNVAMVFVPVKGSI